MLAQDSLRNYVKAASSLNWPLEKEVIVREIVSASNKVVETVRNADKNHPEMLKDAKIMKITEVKHKMLGWDGPEILKNSTPETMNCHFIYFSAEMRSNEDTYAELVINAEVEGAKKKYEVSRNKRMIQTQHKVVYITSGVLARRPQTTLKRLLIGLDMTSQGEPHWKNRIKKTAKHPS